jgi:voltage-gated potassium channel Kch
MAERKFPLHRLLGQVPGVRWLVAAFVVISFACATLMQFVGKAEFSSFGLALWWAVQTVTTVGYGDVTPTTATGKAIAGVLMVSSVALITLVTATISASYVARMQHKRGVVDPLLVEAIDKLEARLDAIETKLDALAGSATPR